VFPSAFGQGIRGGTFYAAAFQNNSPKQALTRVRCLERLSIRETVSRRVHGFDICMVSKRGTDRHCKLRLLQSAIATAVYPRPLNQKQEGVMLVSAMILGILGGIFGLLVGLFGYVVGGLAGAAGESGGGFLQIVSIAIPVASIVGGAMVKGNTMTGAGLMILSAVGMTVIFGFNFFTAIPLVLSTLGGVLGFITANQMKTVSRAG